jgi:hypothetical protein
VTPQEDTMAFIRMLSRSAFANANDKWAFHFEFFSDRLDAPIVFIVLWLALCLGWVILQARKPTPPTA